MTVEVFACLTRIRSMFNLRSVKPGEEQASHDTPKRQESADIRKQSAPSKLRPDPGLYGRVPASPTGLIREMYDIGDSKEGHIGCQDDGTLSKRQNHIGGCLI